MTQTNLTWTLAAELNEMQRYIKETWRIADEVALGNLLADVSKAAYEEGRALFFAEPVHNRVSELLEQRKSYLNADTLDVDVMFDVPCRYLATTLLAVIRLGLAAFKTSSEKSREQGCVRCSNQMLLRHPYLATAAPREFLHPDAVDETVLEVMARDFDLASVRAKYGITQFQYFSCFIERTLPPQVALGMLGYECSPAVLLLDNMYYQLIACHAQVNTLAIINALEQLPVTQKGIMLEAEITLDNPHLRIIEKHLPIAFGSPATQSAYAEELTRQSQFLSLPTELRAAEKAKKHEAFMAEARKIVRESPSTPSDDYQATQDELSRALIAAFDD